MTAAKIISLAAGITHSLFTLLYLLIAFRIPSIYQGIDIDRPNAIISNWPLITSLVFAIISFIFWVFLKNKEKQDVHVGYGIIVSIFLLGAPFLIFFLVGVYADFMMSKVINETL